MRPRGVDRRSAMSGVFKERIQRNWISETPWRSTGNYYIVWYTSRQMSVGFLTLIVVSSAGRGGFSANWTQHRLLSPEWAGHCNNLNQWISGSHCMSENVIAPGTPSSVSFDIHFNVGYLLPRRASVLERSCAHIRSSQVKLEVFLLSHTLFLYPSNDSNFREQIKTPHGRLAMKTTTVEFRCHDCIFSHIPLFKIPGWNKGKFTPCSLLLSYLLQKVGWNSNRKIWEVITYRTAGSVASPLSAVSYLKMCMRKDIRVFKHHKPNNNIKNYVNKLNQLYRD
jgi:hypothetical protein